MFAPTVQKKRKQMTLLEKDKSEKVIRITGISIRKTNPNQRSDCSVRTKLMFGKDMQEEEYPPSYRTRKAPAGESRAEWGAHCTYMPAATQDKNTQILHSASLSSEVLLDLLPLCYFEAAIGKYKKTLFLPHSSFHSLGWFVVVRAVGCCCHQSCRSKCATFCL